MFSVTILHKKLELTQWFALVLLMIGVALVQVIKYALFIYMLNLFFQCSIVNFCSKYFKVVILIFCYGYQQFKKYRKNCSSIQ